MKRGLIYHVLREWLPWALRVAANCITPEPFPTCELPQPWFADGVAFNVDATPMNFSAVFVDQMSAYRARNAWRNVLADSFLLLEGSDYELRIDGDINNGCFCLYCDIFSACGRYTYWRLINRQAEEACKAMGLRA